IHEAAGALEGEGEVAGAGAFGRFLAKGLARSPLTEETNIKTSTRKRGRDSPVVVPIRRPLVLARSVGDAPPGHPPPRGVHLGARARHPQSRLGPEAAAQRQAPEAGEPPDVADQEGGEVRRDRGGAVPPPPTGAPSDSGAPSRRGGPPPS
ncbi:hypothetical protein THAOC_19573, partial [Thalassiosira oceanica]